MKLKFTSLKGGILILLALFSAGGMNAQVWSENFDGVSSLPSGWQVFDVDGDGFDWTLTPFDDYSGSGNCLGSASYDNGAGNLSPNNFVVTDTIDLTGLSVPSLTLTYQVMAPDANYDNEKYDVMVATSSDSTSVVNGAVLFSDDLNGTGGSYGRRDVDLSTYIGQKVFLIFRHHSSSGEWRVHIDEISIIEPYDFDVDLVGLRVRDFGFGLYGYFPFFDVPPMIYTAKLRNAGSNPVEGYTLSGNVTSFQATVNESRPVTVYPGDTSILSGEVDLISPTSGNTYTLSLTAGIDSTDQSIDNNTKSDVIVASTTDDWYTRIDTAVMMNMTQAGADFWLGPNLIMAAERWNGLSFLQSPSPGTLDYTKVYYGASFPIRVKTEVLSVEAVVAPPSTGQETWVEVFEYDNAFNTIGLPVEPVYVSDTMTIPSGYDDGAIHLLEYDLSAKPLYLEEGKKYVVCVLETANTPENAIGILGLFDESNNYSVNNSAVFGVEVYDATQDTLAFGGFNDVFTFFSGSAEVYETYPIALRVRNVDGIAEDLDVSEEINVFPNPTAGDVNVVINANNFKPRTIVVRDIAGRRVRMVSGIYGKKMISLNVNDLDKGIYFLELNDGKHKAIKKIVVE